MPPATRRLSRRQSAVGTALLQRCGGVEKDFRNVRTSPYRVGLGTPRGRPLRSRDVADQGGRDESSRDGGYDPGSIRDRSDFAAQLSRARSRAGKTIRALARELDHPPATIGGYFSGQHLPGVAQTELFTRLLRLIGITGDTETDQWVEALVRVRRRPGRRPTDSSIPYRGLESFRTEDAALFFGREILTDAVVRRALELVKDPAAGTTMVVVGPSGSGKSSLLRAGVVPSVLDGRTEFGSSWRTIVVCPGSRPIRRLAEALAGEIGDDADALEARLRSGPAGWPALPTGVGGLVVVVDQFEEVFTTCTDESERRAFLSILRGPSPSTDSQPSQVVVILGLRADFYGRATQEPSLVPVLQDRQLVVGPMGVDELCRAIKEPARVAGFEVDDALVDLLVAEVAPSRSGVPLQDQGALPLLSHALLETWKRARGSRLTVADYEATGGIAGAVQQTAERLYAESTPEEQAFTRRLFLRLVNVEDDVIVTRRSVRRGELLGRVGDDDGHAADVLESVVERFVAHRLLTVDADVIQVSHEALLTAWPRLRDWVDADRAGLRVHRQLGAASTAWLEADRDPAALLRGGRLEVAEGWASAIDHRAT